jgi:hypothetical protein
VVRQLRRLAIELTPLDRQLDEIEQCRAIIAGSGLIPRLLDATAPARGAARLHRAQRRHAVQRRRRPSAGVVVGRHAIGILVDVDQITAIKLVKHGIRWSARPVENV